MAHYPILRYTDDMDDFQKNKMAARIQNGRRWAQNAHFDDVFASKIGQSTPI